MGSVVEVVDNLWDVRVYDVTCFSFYERPQQYGRLVSLKGQGPPCAYFWSSMGGEAIIFYFAKQNCSLVYGIDGTPSLGKG